MLEYERMKENDLFFIIKRNTISDDSVTVFARKVRSLSKHINDIVKDYRIINNGIIGFTKLQSIHPVLLQNKQNFKTF